MQLNATRYPNMGVTGRTIVAEEGGKALWKVRCRRLLG